MNAQMWQFTTFGYFHTHVIMTDNNVSPNKQQNQQNNKKNPKHQTLMQGQGARSQLSSSLLSLKPRQLYPQLSRSRRQQLQQI